MKYVQSVSVGRKNRNVQLPGEINNNISESSRVTTILRLSMQLLRMDTELTLTPITDAWQVLLRWLIMGLTIMKPYIVDSIIDKNGEITYTEPKEVATPISANELQQQVTQMLISVAENGYDKKVRIPGYSIAAKTGTAQIQRSGVYTLDVRHAFIGYAPANDPKFIGILMLENPKDIRFASDSLAPVFRRYN